MGEVLNGDIVPADQGPDMPPGSKGGRRGPGNGNGRGQSAFADEDTVAAVIAARVQGRSLRDIAREYGIAPQTVANWCGDDLKNKQRAEVPLIRAKAAQQLETARREAWGLYNAAKLLQLPKVMAEMLVRVESTTMSLAKLEGAIMPVRVDMQVTAVTEAEQELQEMLNEAAVRAATEERSVIDAANADPDL